VKLWYFIRIHPPDCSRYGQYAEYRPPVGYFCR
jgi:hypothetical protein